MLGNIKDLAMLVMHGLCFNLYLYLLFYSDFNTVIIRGFLYASMALVMLYLALAKRSEFNLINNLTFVINFLLIFLTLLGLTHSGIRYMLIYNGSIIVTSIFILHSAIRHDYFKNS